MTYIIRPLKKSVLNNDLADESPAVHAVSYQMHRTSREIFWNQKMTKIDVARQAAWPHIC